MPQRLRKSGYRFRTSAEPFPRLNEKDCVEVNLLGNVIVLFCLHARFRLYVLTYIDCYLPIAKTITNSCLENKPISRILIVLSSLSESCVNLMMAYKCLRFKTFEGRLNTLHKNYL